MMYIWSHLTLDKYLTADSRHVGAECSGVTLNIFFNKCHNALRLTTAFSVQVYVVWLYLYQNSSSVAPPLTVDSLKRSLTEPSPHWLDNQVKALRPLSSESTQVVASYTLVAKRIEAGCLSLQLSVTSGVCSPCTHAWVPMLKSAHKMQLLTYTVPLVVLFCTCAVGSQQLGLALLSPVSLVVTIHKGTNERSLGWMLFPWASNADPQSDGGGISCATCNSNPFLT